MAPKFLLRDHFQALLDVLLQAGYRCVGPRLRDGAIVYDTVQKEKDFPAGVQDRQAPGEYRIEQTGERRFFDWANGPQAIKPLLFKPNEVLWRAERGEDGGIAFTVAEPQVAPLAVIGVRACDLAGMRIQDRVFLTTEQPDPYYAARREQLFVVAVNCTRPSASCFCVSTGDGPRATHSYDLVLTELKEGFLIALGSDAGRGVLDRLSLSDADPARLEDADFQIQRAGETQTRALPARDLRAALFGSLDHPNWDLIAERCLACGNCTLVCPTCFCHAENEQPDLDGCSTAHHREWDSCFSDGHSYIHGLNVRPDIRLRYRQWLTHKLGSWHDQFGTSGCVGCGRCITWCPAGIDITEEVMAICGT